MKLRSKETGEIIPAEAREDGIYLFDKTTEQWNKYELPLLAEYWEYCREPKEFWYISQDGGIFLDTDTITQDNADRLEAIGNYFKTEEEAEKAVEKLKAWKRLKDNGFSFEGTNNNKRRSEYFINYYLGKSFNSQEECEQAMKDLVMLFGGKE